MEINDFNDQVSSWTDSFMDKLPSILLAAFVVFVFVVIGRIIRIYIRKAGNKISNNVAVGNLVALISYIGVIIVGLVIALNILNLSGAATSIVAGAGIAGVALGFAFQDIAANFISGIILSIQRPMKIGDLVETNDIFGIVKHINLRSTEIETLNGQYIHVPNQDILLNPLIDYSHKKVRRIELTIGVAYNSDLKLARDTALTAINSLPMVSDDHPVDLYYNEFSDSSINFTARFWTPFKKQIDFLSAQSEAIIAIKRAFDKEGITIPFPMRTIEFAPGTAPKLAIKGE